jgi:hypothetical protein
VIISGVRDFILRTTRHPIGFVGLNITTISGILLVVLLAAQLFGFAGNPYVGILTFGILPGLFVLGLLMMPLSSWMYRRRLRRGGKADALYPVYDLNSPNIRSRLMFIGVMTAINLTIVAVLAYRGLEFMDSVSFCGQTCHPIMKPEFTVYKTSPHSRVRCVDCHIGPGASWFVKSKLSGTRQVIKQIAGTYPRPIETPVANLRPSRDTCEECHWPEKFHGDKMMVKTHYQEDEANTPIKSVLLLKVGGGNPESGFPRGIHSHIINRVYYRSDEKREFIPYIRVERADGTVTDYQKSGMETLPDSIASRPLRLMDCIDCHNRPTHIYRMPSRALDDAITSEQLPNDLPYLKREALKAITQTYPDGSAAREQITAALTSFYQTNYPDLIASDAPKIQKAIAGTIEIWSLYVYPELNITWGTYPDHIGHQDFTGCFRCHDEDHVSTEGKTISQDCSTCHNLLAVEEPDPEVLKALFPEGQ